MVTYFLIYDNYENPQLVCPIYTNNPSKVYVLHGAHRATKTIQEKVIFIPSHYNITFSDKPTRIVVLEYNINYALFAQKNTKFSICI